MTTNTTTKALTLKAVDYKENDKIIWLYSLQYGKIFVNAKGIKKPTAKLRYCSQPFCFGDFELVQTHDYFTLTNCEQVDCFYSLREDVEKYLCGCAILDCLCTIEDQQNPSKQLFVLVLRCLQWLCENDDGKGKIVLSFLLQYLQILGLKPNFSLCSACKTQNPKRTYLDTQFGGTVCQDCRTQNSFEVSKTSLQVFKLLDGMPIDKLKNVTIPNQQLKDCLKILHTYIQQTNSPVKSIAELIKML